MLISVTEFKPDKSTGGFLPFVLQDEQARPLPETQ